MNIELIHDDSCNALNKLIEKGVLVDLIVTSPPYDNQRVYDETVKWDFNTFKNIADQLYNILKDGGVIVWIVGDAL